VGLFKRLGLLSRRDARHHFDHRYYSGPDGTDIEFLLKSIGPIKKPRAPFLAHEPRWAGSEMRAGLSYSLHSVSVAFARINAISPLAFNIPSTLFVRRMNPSISIVGRQSSEECPFRKPTSHAPNGYLNWVSSRGTNRRQPNWKDRSTWPSPPYPPVNGPFEAPRVTPRGFFYSYLVLAGNARGWPTNAQARDNSHQVAFAG
jgi:hypothetical protein